MYLLTTQHPEIRCSSTRSKNVSYCLTENAACAHYEEQVINPVYGNNLSLLWESFDTCKNTVQQNAVSHCFHRFCMWLPLGSK